MTENVEKIAKDFYSKEKPNFTEIFQFVKNVEECVNENPKNADKALQIAEDIVCSYGGISDLRPSIASLYNTACNVVADDKVVNSISRLEKNDQKKFLMKSFADIIDNHLQMAEFLYDKTCEFAIGCDKNSEFLASDTIMKIISKSPAEITPVLLKKNKNLSPNIQIFLFKKLGKLVENRPDILPLAKRYVQNFQPRTSADVCYIYNNAVGFLIADKKNAPEYINLIEKFLVAEKNDVSSLKTAYVALGIMRNDVEDTTKIDSIFEKALKLSCNTPTSRRLAYRNMKQFDKICSEISLGQRVSRSAKNQFSWKNVDNVPANKVAVLFLGGDGTTTERAANGYLKSMEELLKQHKVEEKIGLYSIVYDFGSFDDYPYIFDQNLARTKMMADYHHNVSVKGRYLSADTINPQYMQQIFDKVFLPRICDKNGQRLSVEKACKNIRKLNIITHCHGAYTFMKLEEMMQQKMQNLGYDLSERALIQKQMLCIAHSPYCPLGVSKSTMIAFGSAKDRQMLHYNYFQSEVQKLQACGKMKLSYFAEKKGNIFITPSFSNDGEIDEHNFVGYCSEQSGLTKEGKALIKISGDVVVNGIKSSLEGTCLPNVEELVCGNDRTTKALFNVISRNGEDIHKKMVISARITAKRMVKSGRR